MPSFSRKYGPITGLSRDTTRMALGEYGESIKDSKTTQVNEVQKRVVTFFGELPENLPISTGQKIRFFQCFVL